MKWLLHFGTGTSIVSALSLPWNRIHVVRFRRRAGTAQFGVVFGRIAACSQRSEAPNSLRLRRLCQRALVFFIPTIEAAFAGSDLLFGFRGARSRITVLADPEIRTAASLLGWSVWLLTQSPFIVAAMPLPSVAAYVRGTITRDEFLAGRIRPYPVFQYVNRYPGERQDLHRLLRESRLLSRSAILRGESGNPEGGAIRSHRIRRPITKSAFGARRHDARHHNQ